MNMVYLISGYKKYLNGGKPAVDVTAGMSNDIAQFLIALQWRHNGRNGVSNHQPHDCLLNRVFNRRPI